MIKVMFGPGTNTNNPKHAQPFELWVSQHYTVGPVQPALVDDTLWEGRANNSSTTCSLQAD